MHVQRSGEERTLSEKPRTSTGLLGEEASRLWRKIAAEGKRFRRKVVWQPCSAQREECHGVEKNFDVFSHLKSAVNVTFAVHRAQRGAEIFRRPDHGATCGFWLGLNS